ncbi:malonate decarboxylase holo-ACP synthase [Pseudonocardia xinjiangensis]|uniref:malonate decarboxylase holo-ACP synthase n=1 Tax=Pseudonocardia xinjiangensis TaxID=75289 RepID=UPI003D89E3AA
MEPRTTAVTPPQPHDLLRLSGAAADALPAGAPSWVRSALRATPWVVVRRAAVPDGLIAVGVRGSGRSHRHAWSVTPHDVVRRVAPEDLVDVPSASGAEVAAIRAFRAVRTLLDESGMAWGPTGSVGFELTTGSPTASPDSDLDLLVRAPQLTSAVLNRLAAVRRHLDRSEVRVDCQVEIRTGAIALDELLSAGRDVLVKTPLGPQLLPRALAVR